ncbi:hypothetical protein BG015_005968 [Linnemannia schmuckeri]|uniref:NAD(P)-binding protein n=1 Tax=Linnemannia schmuckeri TaxID=64567 RepID=A0A9P5S3U1_9FUNG|nr:hypothetical protein BG015_005968 [Linnemannia schmuckeri]
MTTDQLPPRAEWYDNFMSGLTKKSKYMPYFIALGVVGVTELGFNVWQRRQQPDLEEQSKKRLQGWIDQAKTTAAAAAQSGASPRVAVVTGGNAGLGLHTSKALVEAGYRVIIACRSVKKGAEAVQSIEEQTGIKGMASVMALDLSSFESIKAFTVEFKLLGHGLDLLVNNAGLMDIPFTLTADGFESQFGVNHLGHYKLTLELLPLLHNSHHGHGRIVILSSAAMYPSQGIPYPQLRSKPGYSRLGSYSHSKLANMLFVKALNRRLSAAGSQVTVNAAHPGTCRTDLFSNNPIANLPKGPAKGMFRSAEVGAMGAVYLSLAPELEGVSGEYFFDQIVRMPSANALDEEQQELLWAKSVEYTGIDFKL